MTLHTPVKYVCRTRRKKWILDPRIVQIFWILIDPGGSQRILTDPEADSLNCSKPVQSYPIRQKFYRANENLS
jgi:hypothetical protein